MVVVFGRKLKTTTDFCKIVKSLIDDTPFSCYNKKREKPGAQSSERRNLIVEQQTTDSLAPYLTIVLSCADPTLELRLAEALGRAGYSVEPVKLNFPSILHRVYQSQAKLLILQTNTGKVQEEEIRRCHFMGCKVLLLETHLPSTEARRLVDAWLTLPVDPASVLEIIPCLFSAKEFVQAPPRLTLDELLERWQVTKKQPNRGMIEQTILLTVDHPQWIRHITKDIYPRLASQNRLSVSAVEQRLRRAIAHLFLHCQDELFRFLFPDRRPSNSTFFLQIARYLSGFSNGRDEKSAK